MNQVQELSDSIIGVYEGDVVDNIREGTGTSFASTPLKNSISCFLGKLSFPQTGDYYDGEFRGGYRAGFGKYVCNHGKRVYEGEWQQSRRHGQGKETWMGKSPGLVCCAYEGKFQKDLFHGRGILRKMGTRYEGDFTLGSKNGEGRMDYPDGSYYEGRWDNNRCHGRGKYTKNTGEEYEGDWINGQRYGQGVNTDVKGVIFDGEWQNNVKHGSGSITYPTGKTRTGVWKNGNWASWTTEDFTKK